MTTETDKNQVSKLSQVVIAIDQPRNWWQFMLKQLSQGAGAVAVYYGVEALKKHRASRPELKLTDRKTA